MMGYDFHLNPHSSRRKFMSWSVLLSSCDESFSFCHFLFAHNPLHFIVFFSEITENEGKKIGKETHHEGIVSQGTKMQWRKNEDTKTRIHERREKLFPFKTNLMAKTVWWICFWWPSPLVSRWQTNIVLCNNLSLFV